MRTPLRLENVDPRLVVGIVEAFDVRAAPSGQALVDGTDLLIERRAEQENFPPPELKDGIRALLRAGGYKPSGRGKPASEYLVGAARKGAFPRISNLVDAANRYSLLTGLPISLLDLDRALEGTDGLVIRLGREGESYVFNESGQEIDLDGLLSVAREDGAPIGNAVKDSLATRTNDETKNVIAVIWCTRDVAPAEIVERMAEQLGAQLAEHANADHIESCVLAP
jgi:DNA/RNA-binding domain of Phe-tRNA-synthetase-like protein